MKTELLAKYDSVFEKALAAKYGVAVRTENPKLLKQHLYTARRELGNSDYMTLSFITPHEKADEVVWVVKGDIDVAAPNGKEDAPLI